MKKKYYISLGVLALFIITNPSASAFKSYIGSNTYSGLKRTTNFFICSLYKHGYNEYFGILGNFWQLGEEKKKLSTQISSDSIKAVDSSIMADSGKMKMYKTSGYTSDGLPILRKK